MLLLFKNIFILRACITNCYIYLVVDKSNATFFVRALAEQNANILLHKLQAVLYNFLFNSAYTTRFS